MKDRTSTGQLNNRLDNKEYLSIAMDDEVDKK